MIIYLKKVSMAEFNERFWYNFYRIIDICPAFGVVAMDVVSKEHNRLSQRRIVLQNEFSQYVANNGFSYEEWLNPPAGSFFESYKKELDEINAQIAPELGYYD